MVAISLILSFVLIIVLLWCYIILFSYEEETDKLNCILTIDEDENIVDIKLL